MAGDNLVEQVREVTGGAMADVVIVGPGTARRSPPESRRRARARPSCSSPRRRPDDEMLVRPHDLYFNETRLVPSYSCGPDDTREALDLVERGVINARRTGDASVSRSRKLPHAFAAAQKPESLKVIVTFGE